MNFSLHHARRRNALTFRLRLIMGRAQPSSGDFAQHSLDLKQEPAGSAWGRIYAAPPVELSGLSTRAQLLQRPHWSAGLASSTSALRRKWLSLNRAIGA